MNESYFRDNIIIGSAHVGTNIGLKKQFGDKSQNHPKNKLKRKENNFF
jgi:hypothetical protein